MPHTFPLLSRGAKDAERTSSWGYFEVLVCQSETGFKISNDKYWGVGLIPARQGNGIASLRGGGRCGQVEQTLFYSLSLKSPCQGRGSGQWPAEEFWPSNKDVGVCVWGGVQAGFKRKLLETFSDG